MLLCLNLLKCNNYPWITSYALSYYFYHWKPWLKSYWQLKSDFRPFYVYCWVFVCHIFFNVINSIFSLNCMSQFLHVNICCDQIKYNAVMCFFNVFILLLWFYIQDLFIDTLTDPSTFLLPRKGCLQSISFLVNL